MGGPSGDLVDEVLSLGRFPSRDFAITAWLSAVAIAADLTAWLRLLALN